jgi:hypothetical protein
LSIIGPLLSAISAIAYRSFLYNLFCKKKYVKKVLKQVNIGEEFKEIYIFSSD